MCGIMPLSNIKSENSKPYNSNPPKKWNTHHSKSLLWYATYIHKNLEYQYVEKHNVN